MTASLPEPLLRAGELIRSGKAGAARPLLVEYLRLNPASVPGWLLLSQAVSEPEKKIDCLRRVLRIDPNNPLARSRLDQLLQAGSPPAAPAPPAEFQAAQVNEPVPPPLPEAPPQEAPPQEASPTVVPPQPEQSQPPPASPVPPFVETAPEFSSLLSHATPDPSHSLSEDLRSALGRTPPPTPAPASDAAHGSDRAAARGARQTPNRLQRNPGAWMLAIGSAFGLLLLIGTLAVFINLKNRQNATIQQTQAALLGTPQPRRILPPTWTYTPTPLPSATPTITPTPLPTATPTLRSPAPTQAAQMEVIQQQVADLRGLEIQGEVSRHILNQGVAEQVLTGYLVDAEFEAELRDQARVLAAFGLIKPTYDLTRYVLNGLVDNIGGVYIPWKKQIFILGVQFSGIEHYVYSHEFDHALVDQHFHFDQMGVYPQCESNAQRCDAIQALVEGDATLLMNQWWQQYATPRDYQDILRYRPPSLAIPEQYPPPYVSMDVSFPYLYGYEFVNSLYQRGNWARVNQVYSDLPDSTEQIMHPEKYLRGETPVEVVDTPLHAALSPDWRELDSDVLGEWTTYLILGYGADLAAQLEDATAAEAAAGWGGDAYQVYYQDRVGDLVLAAHWSWDSQADARQFLQAMQAHLEQRFRGNQLARADGAAGSSGSCWQAAGQTTCLYRQDAETLWLITPDGETAARILSLYPNFQ